MGPDLALILRLAQGFSTGGEWGGAAAFLVEHAPVGKRGFIGSFHQVATQIGNFTGFILAALLAYIFTTEAFQQWGWRIAFLVGALLAPVGYYLRTRVAETPVFQQAEARKKVASYRSASSLPSIGRSSSLAPASPRLQRLARLPSRSS